MKLVEKVMKKENKAFPPDSQIGGLVFQFGYLGSEWKKEQKL